MINMDWMLIKYSDKLRKPVYPSAYSSKTRQ